MRPHPPQPSTQANIMMANPKKGTRVRLHYRVVMRTVCPHGATGTVEIISRGRPRNHGIRLDDGRLVAVPCGNLVKADH